MPAAELFGIEAVARAAASAAGTAVAAVISVGDYQPAAVAVNAATSGTAQIRALLLSARTLTKQWLAVSVPREANGDVDRLSHPLKGGAVASKAREAGLVVHHAPIPVKCWAELREALVEEHGTERPTRRHRRRC
eukprot:5512330-Pleurochrysis_carterae.AAC.2